MLIKLILLQVEIEVIRRSEIRIDRRWLRFREVKHRLRNQHVRDDLLLDLPLFGLQVAYRSFHICLRFEFVYIWHWIVEVLLEYGRWQELPVSPL